MNGRLSSVSRLSQGGFTIVETLIVLGVSGMLFLGAILLVAGQQRKVEFTQAAQDIQSVIRQNISEVGSGYYPNGGNVRCVVAGNNLNITQVAAGTAQGSNTGCVFLGKVMQFGVAGTNPQEYVVHTVAGLQDGQDGSLLAANPKVVNIDSSRITGQLRNGLTISSMRYVKDGVRTNIGAVAFLNGLGNFEAGTGLMSGTQQLTLVPVANSGTVPSTTVIGVVGAIDTQLRNADNIVNPNGGVELCFAGDRGQWALATIGGNGRDLSVKLDIKSADCS